MKKGIGKKGVSVVDWIISFGIFLIYVLIMLIFIKPGYRPMYASDLADIVEDGFKENVYWIVKKVPLFVWNCDMSSVGCDGVAVTVTATGWNSNMNSILFKQNPTGKNATWLVFYPTADSSTINFVINSGTTGCECMAELGSVIDINGISNDKISNVIVSQKYNDLKTRWNFPQNRDFVVYINNEKKTAESPEPYQGANVYVRDWKDWIVNKDGTKEDVKVNLRAW